MGIIVLANQKGGVGKTAIAIHLAHALKRLQPGKTLLVDADPSKSAIEHFMQSGENETPYSITRCDVPDIHRRLPQMLREGGFDHCIVDCPAGLSDITKSALILADLIIIPVQPSLCDFYAAATMKPLLENTAMINPDVQILVVISRAMPGKNLYTQESREEAEKFFTFPGLHIKVAHQRIFNRAEMVRAYTDGKTLFEYSRLGSSAQEFTALAEEVAQCLPVMA